MYIDSHFPHDTQDTHILSSLIKVDESEKMQKDVYLTLCQRFISVLGDHLARCDQEGSDYESPWFQATLDHFRQLLVKVCVWCCVCVCTPSYRPTDLIA